MKSYPMFVMYPAGETKRMGKTLEKRADLGVGDGRGIESQSLMQFIKDNRVSVSPKDIFDTLAQESEVEVEL